MPGSLLPEGFDATNPAVLAQGIPHAQLAEMRQTSPVVWVPQVRGSSGFDDEGYWAVTRHADVMAVSRDTDTFSSWENTAIPRFRHDIGRENIEMQRAVMLNIDPPYHTKIRNVVSRGFTPRAIAALRGALADRAEKIVRGAAGKGTGEFVEDVACELPLQAIAELIGVPQEDRKQIFEWSNLMVGYDEPGSEMQYDPLTAAMELLAYAMKMGEDRQAEPRDDIVTKLVNAEIDGSHLTIDEFGFFVMLLAVAGNETTRNAITHGMLAFFEHPDQWELFKAERPKTFVDEIIRWATPVNVFQRTATTDTEFRGAPIQKGDRVCIFYGSANYDEDVFADPHTFDILRSPNPHLGFGGSGAHYCLGANLARLEIELMFNAIADIVPDIRQVGPADRLFSGWVHGIKALPVEYGEIAERRPVNRAAEEEVAANLISDVMNQFASAHQRPDANEPAEIASSAVAATAKVPAQVPAQRKPRAKADTVTPDPAPAKAVKAPKAAKAAKKAAPAQAAASDATPAPAAAKKAPAKKVAKKAPPAE